MSRLYISRDSTALSLGAEQVAQALALQTQGQNVDIVRNGSRGLYWLEPLVEVETAEGRLAYGPVQAKDVPSLLAAGLLEGGQHPLCLGNIEDLTYFKKQNRLTFARVGLTDPVSIGDYLAHAGYRGLKNALTLQPAEIVKHVSDSGLRGRGGAAFPTGIKWNTVLNAPAGQKYIVCNADEGDSGTFSDRMIMEGDPFVLIEGMTIAGLAVGATKGYIYLRVEYPHRLRRLESSYRVCGKKRLPGRKHSGQRQNFSSGSPARRRRLYLRRRNFFAGEPGRQTRPGALQAALTGYRRIVGKPTVVNNVISLASVPIIWTKAGSITGIMALAAHAVRCPCNLRVILNMPACSKPRSA